MIKKRLKSRSDKFFANVIHIEVASLLLISSLAAIGYHTASSEGVIGVAVFILAYFLLLTLAIITLLAYTILLVWKRVTWFQPIPLYLLIIALSFYLIWFQGVEQ